MKIGQLTVGAILLVNLWGCNEDPKIKEVSTPAPAAFTPLSRAYVKTDTVRFTNDSTRMAVVGVMKGVLQADSSLNVAIDVLYYVKGRQVYAYSGTVTATTGDEELSHYFEDTDTSGNSCERFFTATYGFGACGYTQNHFTFFASDSNCYFVAAHSSVADGAYGAGLEFYKACDPNSATQISAAAVSREPMETDDNMILVSYSDSTVYRFDPAAAHTGGNAWSAQLVTEKGKVYRTVKEEL